MTKVIVATGRRPDGAAFVIALILAVIGAVMIREGMTMPDRGGYSGVGPGGAPKLVGWCLVGLAGWTVVAGLKGTLGPRAPQNVLPVIWIVAGLALQLVLLRPLGFTIASGILFACTAAAFGQRRFHISLPAGIVMSFIIYGIFDRLLQLNLPAGPLETLIYGG